MWWILPVFAGVVGFSMFLYGGLVIEGAGGLVERLYIGRETETAPQYSYADSLVARGMYERAVDAYEAAAAENPRNPEPLMRMARVYRDELRRPDEAIATFKRARQVEGAPPGQANLATREIVEILLGSEDRRRAIPELARLAEQAAGTKTGDWAGRRLSELKQELARMGQGQGQGDTPRDTSREDG